MDKPYYNFLTRFFHWVIFLLFACLIYTVVQFHIAPEQELHSYYVLHKSLGATIFVLMVLRIIWTLLTIKSRPAPVNKLSSIVHGIIYLLALVVPGIGLLRAYGDDKHPLVVWGVQVMAPAATKNEFLAQLGDNWHSELAWVLFGLLVLHILGVIYHHYFRGEKQILSRMVGFQLKH